MFLFVLEILESTTTIFANALILHVPFQSCLYMTEIQQQQTQRLH